MQLRSGNVPDLVLFYTIGGDIVLHTNRSSRRPENLDQIAARFEGRREPCTFVDRLRSTYFIRVDRRAYGQTDDRNRSTERTACQLLDGWRTVSHYESMGIDVAKLSDLIVQDYLGNYKIVSALAQKYGFKYFFLCRPAVSLHNKPLTPEEQEMTHKLESEAAL